MRWPRHATALITTGVLLTGVSGAAFAQRSGAAAETPRSSAPIDLTGYWVAVVSEDWRHRMATPRKGDYESLPLNAEGRRVADGWSLDADNAAGLQCKAFGVGGLMRQPGRLHITWTDDDTLRAEFDAGTQTRLLELGAAAAPASEKITRFFRHSSRIQANLCCSIPPTTRRPHIRLL